MTNPETPLEIARKVLADAEKYPAHKPLVILARAVIDLSEPNIARLAAIAERVRIVAAIRKRANALSDVGHSAYNRDACNEIDTADWIERGCPDE